jgi:hypothetical protein
MIMRQENKTVQRRYPARVALPAASSGRSLQSFQAYAAGANRGRRGFEAAHPRCHPLAAAVPPSALECLMLCFNCTVAWQRLADRWHAWVSDMVPKHRWFRVLLHLAVFIRTRRNWRWHWRCICREF